MLKKRPSTRLAIRNDLVKNESPSLAALLAQATIAAGLPLAALFEMPAREWFQVVGERLGKVAA